ncbi:nucleotidyltransferase domain-containing protein [Streptomyces sp. NPDC093097]|uniref:nucleotidyltransferase domain-containing protein n=1 Tax=Streptomyces sp. NPDC093097 TaxID=3366027 RepID=UPI0037FCB708
MYRPEGGRHRQPGASPHDPPRRTTRGRTERAHSGTRRRSAGGHRPHHALGRGPPRHRRPALVGSYARNAARPDSDIDIVLLTTDRSRYADDGAPRTQREVSM